MPALISALKNEHTKRILRATRIRPPGMRHGTTAHYRMPVLEAAGGYAPLPSVAAACVPDPPFGASVVRGFGWPSQRARTVVLCDRTAAGSARRR